jgi:hypothetical protein
MPHLVASIAEHQDVFVIVFTTLLAWLIVVVLVGYLEEHRRVEICDLRAVFDDVGRGNGTWCTVS